MRQIAWKQPTVYGMALKKSQQQQFFREMYLRDPAKDDFYVPLASGSFQPPFNPF